MIAEGFSLRPLPHPVLSVLLVVLIGISWRFGYDELVESLKERGGWMVVPTALFLVMISFGLLDGEDDSASSYAEPSWDQAHDDGEQRDKARDPTWGILLGSLLSLLLLQSQTAILVCLVLVLPLCYS